MKRPLLSCMVLWVGVLLAGAASAQPAGKPGRLSKLIEWGWDEPTDIEVRKNIAQMEQRPFDGVVISVLGWAPNRRIDLFNVAWGAEAFTHEQFAPAVANLKATSFHRFTDNFLRLNVTPGAVDWFDDAGWKAIVGNGKLASWICKEGGLKGVLFDTEQYNGKIFYYQALPGKDRHTFDEYRAQARKRGQEYGAALTAEKSDATIFLTYATSVFTLQKQNPLEWSDVGLLPAFIDGMLEGADKQAIFVDGLETAYPTKLRSRFEEMRRGVRDAKKHSQVARQYEARMTTGFGLWLDYYGSSPQHHWDPVDTTTNFFKPDEFRTALHDALDVTDKYVWLYTEQIDWWTGKGLSPQYIQAVEAARK